MKSFAPLLLSLVAVVAAVPVSDPIILEGTATAFNVSGVPACGQDFTNLPPLTYFAALSKASFEHFQPTGDADPTHNKACGLDITVFVNDDPSTAIIATVVDRCDGCTGLFDILLTANGFQQLTGRTMGSARVEWQHSF